MTARVDIEGLFGIGMGSGNIASFSVRVKDSSKPFLSATGYCSFLGMYAMPDVGMTPKDYVQRVLTETCPQLLLPDSVNKPSNFTTKTVESNDKEAKP